MNAAPPVPEEPADFQPRGGIGGLLIFVAIALACLAIAYFTDVGKYLQEDSIRKLAVTLGFWGPLVLLVAGIITPLFFMPRWPIAFIAGGMYGVFWGSLLATVASTLGALLHFLLARTLLSPFAERWRHRYGIHAARMEDDKVFVLLFLLRAFPLSSFVATNLLAGALKVRLGIYIAASFLGMIPSTIMYAAWGKLLKKPSAEHIALAIGLLLILIAGTLIARKRLAPWFKQVSKPAE